MFSVRSAFTTLVLGLAALTPFAQSVPATMNYQGRLTDNSPSQVPINTTVNMTFEIWDAPTAGTRLWLEPSSGATPVAVTSGIFNTVLGGNGVAIPATVFTTGTTTRYLQIIANGETLTPRQRISAAGYANQAQNASTAASATTATTATTATNATQLGGVASGNWQRSLTVLTCPANQFYNAIAAGGTAACAAPPANNLTPPVSLTGNSVSPIFSASNTGSGRGLFGTSSGGDGIFGSSTLSDGNGVLGVANTGTSAYGVWGTSTSGRGVVGAGATYGVYGTASAANGSGVYGANGNASSGYGVQGVVTTGQAVYGNATSSGWGVHGQSASGRGVVGESSSGSGVYGTSTTGSAGEFIVNNTGSTAAALSVITNGSGDSVAILGVHSNANPGGSGRAYGVYGQVSAQGGDGVRGDSLSTLGDGYGVLGTSLMGAGVYGQGSNGADGVLGICSGAGCRAGFFIGPVQISSELKLQTLGVAGATALCYNAAQQVATCSSSLRYKTHLKPFSGGLDLLDRLKPIAFEWKADGMPDVGFGAEDVAAVDPLFVTYNARGQVEGVKYDRLTVILTNAVREQQAEIAAQKEQAQAQQSQIEALKAIVCADHPGAGLCGDKH